MASSAQQKGMAKRRRPKEESKALLLKTMRDGYGVFKALEVIGMSRSWYEAERRNDPDFKALVDRHKLLRAEAYTGKANNEMPSFEEFSEEYLGARVFPHMLNVVDMLNGETPRWLHPSMTYEKGEPDLIIANMPPEHPAAFSTPLFTASRGWITVGEVTDDDWLVGRDGMVAPIVDVWTSDGDVDVFDVHFDSGDAIRTSAEHLWNAYPVFERAGLRRNQVHQVSTARLMAEPGQWRLPVADAWDGPDADLPVDPYLFGYWLGDGSNSAAVFAVGFEDIDEFTGQLDMLGVSYRVSMDSRGRSHAVYVHGLRSQLKATGMFGDKDRRIPAEYFLGSFKQRLALLQGLMDADGTITVKDSRARFVQHKEHLSRDVYRLAASLGLKPHFKHYGDAFEVGFRTGVDPVFRLPRKAGRQRPAKGTSKAAHRVVKAVVPAGREQVRCISVLTDTNEYVIGDGMIPTRNAKSTSITMNYVTWRIACDPNIRVLIVSKTQTMAKKFLFGIRTRLTHPKYAAFHARFGPPDGYASGAESWSQDMIYIGGAARDSGEKDPTVQALGVRGQIYGARADLIVLDDCIDGTNAHEFEKQIDWIQSEVVSRISASGALLVVGTRLATRDLYLELRDPRRYPDEESPWTYLAMPAVLEFADNADDWVTLWPKSNVMEIGAKGDMQEPDADGLYPKWDGKRLAKKRARMQPRMWAMVYQQEQVNQDAIFHPQAVAASINGNRMTGPIPKGMVNQRVGGMEGLVIVAGLDPATAGHTAAVIIGLDVQTQRRYVLDLFNKPGVTPEQMRDMIKGYTDRYNIAEWRIEKNGFQGFLVHDRELNEYCTNRGTVIRPHFTGSNKHNADFGVASMTGLFTGWEDKRQLIELPSTHGNEAAKSLVEQLVTWAPEVKKQKTDLLMALWFCELACRDRIQLSSNYTTHQRNPFVTPWDRRNQMTVNLLDLEAARAWQPLGA